MESKSSIQILFLFFSFLFFLFRCCGTVRLLGLARYGRFWFSPTNAGLVHPISSSTEASLMVLATSCRVGRNCHRHCVERQTDFYGLPSAIRIIKQKSFLHVTTPITPVVSLLLAPLVFDVLRVLAWCGFAFHFQMRD